MRLAVLADIHGNLPAFEAAIGHASKQGVDRFLIAGDIAVGGPDSAACWHFAQSLGEPILRGNHERYLAHYGTAKADPLWETEQFAPLQWAISQFTEAERQAIDQLPLTLRLADAPGVLFVHASARNDKDSIYGHTPASNLPAMFPGIHDSLVVRAHNHICQIRIWEHGHIVTSGSVGLPLDSNPSAQYLMLERANGEWHFEHHSVPYDVGRTLRRFEETGFLREAGPIGQLLYREVETASHHMVPFLRAYRRWAQQDPLSLEQAVARYLSNWR